MQAIDFIGYGGASGVDRVDHPPDAGRLEPPDLTIFSIGKHFFMFVLNFHHACTILGAHEKIVPPTQPTEIAMQAQVKTTRNHPPKLDTFFTSYETTKEMVSARRIGDVLKLASGALADAIDFGVEYIEQDPHAPFTMQQAAEFGVVGALADIQSDLEDAIAKSEIERCDRMMGIIQGCNEAILQPIAEAFIADRLARKAVMSSAFGSSVVHGLPFAPGLISSTWTGDTRKVMSELLPVIAEIVERSLKRVEDYTIERSTIAARMEAIENIVGEQAQGRASKEMWQIHWRALERAAMAVTKAIVRAEQGVAQPVQRFAFRRALTRDQEENRLQCLTKAIAIERAAPAARVAAHKGVLGASELLHRMLTASMDLRLLAAHPEAWERKPKPENALEEEVDGLSM